jgi:hypothetical protein
MKSKLVAIQSPKEGLVVLRMHSKTVRESKAIPYRVPLKLVPSPSSIRSGAAGTLTN